MSSHSFNVPRTPVAKKSHRCIWCWDDIITRERYYRFVGIYEGDFQNWAMHLDCQMACEREGDYEYGEICEERHQRGKTCQEMERINLLEKENKQLKTALEQIANHPDSTGPAGSQYNIGVQDGHRCAANIARSALRTQNQAIYRHME